MRGMTESDEPQLEVSAEHTAVALADGSAQVIDVREAYERVRGPHRRQPPHRPGDAGRRRPSRSIASAP